jgi:hypothetical protein
VIRGAIAVVVGLLVWGICATVLDILLRVALPGYAAAEPQMQFTLGMMLARLAFPGALPSIGAGFVSAWIGRGNRLVSAAVAIILVGEFLPVHCRLWTKFPVWYHLTFLSSLILLTGFGARLRMLVAASRERRAAPGTPRPGPSQIRT